MADFTGQLEGSSLAVSYGSLDGRNGTVWVTTADTTAPILSNFTATAGSVLTPSTPLGFDATDNNGTVRVFVFLTFAGSPVAEVAYDGVSFMPLYAGASTAAQISGGKRFSIVRVGGWPGAPTAKIVAIDLYGNEA